MQCLSKRHVQPKQQKKAEVVVENFIFLEYQHITATCHRKIAFLKPELTNILNGAG